MAARCETTRGSKKTEGKMVGMYRICMGKKKPTYTTDSCETNKSPPWEKENLQKCRLVEDIWLFILEVSNAELLTMDPVVLADN